MTRHAGTSEALAANRFYLFVIFPIIKAVVPSINESAMKKYRKHAA